MAKEATIGEMRTKIRIYNQTKGLDSEGFPTEVWTNVFTTQAEPKADPFCWCMWVNAHGTEVFDNLRLELRDVATIMMRYTPLLTPECRIYHESDAAPYEVISIDNISDRRHLMEVNVRRVVTA